MDSDGQARGDASREILSADDGGPSMWLDEKRRASDTQVGGSHYSKFAIQPVVFIMANNLGYCEGNILKYVCRHRDKGGAEDLRKAKHYIDLLLQLEYGANPKAG